VTFRERPQDPAEIIQSVNSGLYVTEIIGPGVNLVTGDYSRSAVGFWIEKGKIAHPVEEITVVGNLKEILLGIEMVGNELVSIHCGSHSGALGGVPDRLPNPVAAYSVKLAALQSGDMLDRGEKEE
jgi:predicted Zn-dependent protease